MEAEKTQDFGAVDEADFVDVEVAWNELQSDDVTRTPTRKPYRIRRLNLGDHEIMSANYSSGKGRKSFAASLIAATVQNPDTGRLYTYREAYRLEGWHGAAIFAEALRRNPSPESVEDAAKN